MGAMISNVLRIIRGKFTLPLLAFIAAFWIAAAIIPTALLGDIVNGMLIGVAAMVTYAYGQGALECLKATQVTKVHHLMLGIVISWIARVALILLFFLERFHLTTEAVWYQFFYWLIVVAGVLHLTAPLSYYSSIKVRWNYVVAAFVLGIGFTMIVEIIVNYPDIGNPLTVR